MKALTLLHQLPRDARDTLFLLLVIAWVVAPQVAHLPLWCSAMSALVLLWRARIALRGQRLPSRWWLLLLLLLASAATFYSHRTLLGRDAGVTFIVVLLALKTLEMRARRDAFVVFFLGFFALLSNFFFSQTLLVALSMVVGLLGLLTALINHHLPVGRPPLALAARTAARMALLGAPIMVLLFVLFPRVAPLWGMPGDASSGRTGLSGQMQVGTLANLALDDSVAMRIRFEGPRPPQQALYFRGPVFSNFDGTDWRPLRSPFAQRLQLPSGLQVSGTPLRYEVTLEGNNHPWLPLLDATPEAPALRGYQARMQPDLQWRADRPISELVRFQAQAYTTFRHGPLKEELALQDFVELPPGFNPRTLQWALELRRDPRYARADASALVELLLDKLRTGGYRYTLEPGVYGRDTADEFWFDRKLGFCEHIASSFVLMLRALDVPARVVTGYQGGEGNSFDDLWTVRQSDAHAWTEVWMAGRGWVRVDPTAAVAPSRTGMLQRLQAPRSVVAQALGAISPGFEINLRALWDATNSRWNQWVLNYSQGRQLNLLRNLGYSAPGWEDLGLLLLGCIVLASLLGAGWTQWERMRQDPWLRLLQRANARLRQAGLALPQGTPPRQMALALQGLVSGGNGNTTVTAVCAAAVDAAELQRIQDWLLRLEAWRYAPPSGPATDQHAGLGTLRRQFRQLRWPRPNQPPATP
jgi:transglutaminase-like putative cysteine protease